MRDVLFRGKRLDNGEWIEGFIVHIDNCWCIQRDNSLVFPPDIDVDPATVGQYTGLTDKNGKRIFEGDIVNHGYKNRCGSFYNHYRVTYSENNACFELIAIDPRNSTKRLTKGNVKSWQTEVIIGNIHDTEVTP